MRKVETNETNFVSVFLVKSIYTSSFGSILFCQLKLVSFIFIFAIKIKL